MGGVMRILASMDRGKFGGVPQFVEIRSIVFHRETKFTRYFLPNPYLFRTIVVMT